MNHAKRFGGMLTLAVVVAASLFNASASAHVLQSDNGVSAILHIKPDDNPVAGKPVPVNFLFSNDVGGFSLNDYKVQLRLIQNKTVKFSSPVPPLFFGASTEGETMATFPEVGVYSLQAKGTPVEKDAPPFTLNFTVRVASAADGKTGSGKTAVILSGFSLIILGMVAAKTIQTGGKYRKPKLK
ncbi:MAG: hypothetical protein QFB87_01185 [Patescibacteria group bacterium]|nr:hypothetical protein [Patescibacteria group bacterium]